MEDTTALGRCRQRSLFPRRRIADAGIRDSPPRRRCGGRHHVVQVPHGDREKSSSGISSDAEGSHAQSESQSWCRRNCSTGTLELGRDIIQPCQPRLRASSVQRAPCGAERCRQHRLQVTLRGTSASSRVAGESPDGHRRPCDASWHSWSTPWEGRKKGKRSLNSIPQLQYHCEFAAFKVILRQVCCRQATPLGTRYQPVNATNPYMGEY